MSTQSHKKLNQKFLRVQKNAEKWEKIQGVSDNGTKMNVDKKRKFPRKCGTVCPRRILEV